MSQEMLGLAEKIAKELKVRVEQVEATIQLLNDGATVPFIARYRKEATGGLDDTQLRHLHDRLHYLHELEERRKVVLASISEQGKLTPVLEQALNEADTKTRLEDLYLPHRPKRRTRAQQAKEAGLEPLADALFANPDLDPEEEAQKYINAELAVEDSKAALEGARQILMERFAEEPDLVNELREYLWANAILYSKAQEGVKKATLARFADYADYSEPLRKIPSHRALALFRGRRESVLKLSMQLPEGKDIGEQRMAQWFHLRDEKRPADAWLMETVRNAWKIKLATKLELELMARLRELADEEAIRVFARNLRGLLLSAPAGNHVTIGLDPGIRTGVKTVVIDATGKLLDYTTLFPFAPQNEWHQAVGELAKLAARHNATLISIGNGTGSRETERLVADMLKMYSDLKLQKLVVSEAGASVYSASELAAKEFPDLDVSLRGAVSIARRLQDPLAELVKIEPKAIGVGQYQHDVNQSRLAHSLEGVVEDCVNAVGVDINTASAPLLTRVAGLNETLAKNLIEYRDEHGAFTERKQLLDVPRMGEKTYQQAAGFLRIINGTNPLDASAVHPEAYPLVEKILAENKVDLKQIIGNKELLNSLNADKYVDDQYGAVTVRDVLRELEKPGRDPRGEFKTVQFKDGVEEIKDLEIDMLLEGVVSNVTNFGAFVDIGVHQDGLVHISEMTDRFISDPHQFIKAGDIVKVRVVEVDKERRRIGLSMKLDKQPEQPHQPRPAKKAPVAKKGKSAKNPAKPAKPVPEVKKSVFNTAMADALSKLKGDL